MRFLDGLRDSAQASLGFKALGADLPMVRRESFQIRKLVPGRLEASTSTGGRIAAGAIFILVGYGNYLAYFSGLPNIPFVLKVVAPIFQLLLVGPLLFSESINIVTAEDPGYVEYRRFGIRSKKIRLGIESLKAVRLRRANLLVGRRSIPFWIVDLLIDAPELPQISLLSVKVAQSGSENQARKLWSQVAGMLGIEVIEELS